MHNATTKQRLSAFRRKFGIWTTLPRWARARRERAEAPAPGHPLAATVAAPGLASPPPAAAAPAPADPSPARTAAADPLTSTVGVNDPALADTVALADPAAALPRPVPVMQPTPPITDLAEGDPQAAEPAAARRRRGIAAGVFAAAVLILLAFLALVPWLRGRAPAES
ncbi:MAG TPA: hypothetical protein VLS93_12165, partial [Anaeromyxobacteraceae bacterium]|nr:hypothetical protein [Anaeromyxobacteraceae bacterium]